MEDEVQTHLIERIARAWASIDGKAEMFDRCFGNPNAERKHGYYGGYVSDARELIKRAGVKVSEAG